MKTITQLCQWSLAFCACALPLAMHADDTQQMGNMAPNTMADANTINSGMGMTNQMGMTSNGMSAGMSQMNNMSTNTMNTMTSPQMGNMAPNVMGATNQMETGMMESNTMNSMTSQQMNNMAPNTMTNQP